MKTKIAAVFLIAGLAIFAVACGDDGSAPQSDGTPPTGTPAEDSTETPAEVPASVQRAIDAATNGDASALAELVRVSRIGCVAEALGAGSPPICEDGEEPGTIIEVLPSAQCEGHYIRSAGIEEALARFVGDGLETYAVYATPQSYFPPGPFSAVFTGTNEGGDTVGKEIIIDNNGVVGVNFGCSGDAAALVQTRGLTDAIVEPE